MPNTYVSSSEANQQWWDNEDALFWEFRAKSLVCDTSISIGRYTEMRPAFDENKAALDACTSNAFEVFSVYSVYHEDDPQEPITDHLVSIGIFPKVVVQQLFTLQEELREQSDWLDKCGFQMNDAMDALAKERAKRTVGELRRDISKNYATVFVSIVRRDGSACRICGQPSADLQIDHIQPVTRGGGNDFANLQLLCPTCNSAKRNQWLEDGGAQ